MRVVASTVCHALDSDATTPSGSRSETFTSAAEPLPVKLSSTRIVSCTIWPLGP